MTASIKANVDGSAAIQVGGSDAINISSGLSVGIGTSSPACKLDVASGGLAANFGSSTAFAGALWKSSTTTGFGRYIAAEADAMTFGRYGVAENMRIDSSGNVGIGTSSPSSNSLTLASKDIVLSDGYGPLWGTSTKAQIAGYSSGILQFFAGGSSERMRIDSGGNLLINATTRASLEKVNITSDGASQEGLIIVNTNTAAGTHTAIGFRRPSATTVGNITTTLSSTAYVTSSDYRLKENVQPMTGALAKVAALKPCTYTWKIDGSGGQGFIAHELAEVVPDAVSGEKDAVNEDGSIKPQGIDTSFLVATLTAAIQEQQQMIETLQAKVAALEGA